MANLQEAESGARVECPPEMGRAIKALAADPRHKLAWDFIVNVLCATDRLSFALPADSAAIMGWQQGRRFVGLTLRDIVEKPIKEDAPKLPPARTATEQARRRNASTIQG